MKDPSGFVATVGPFKEPFILVFKNYILGGIVDTTSFKMIKQVVCDDDV